MATYHRRTAVITGGARGFGKAFGHALAEQGMRVVLLDLDLAAARTNWRARASGSTRSRRASS